MRRVGYAYEPVFLSHHVPGHPESRQRLESVMALLNSRQVLETLAPIHSSPATQAVLARVHHAGYVSALRDLAGEGGGMLGRDTYVTPASYDAAAAAAGAAISATRAVLDGQVDRAFALVRPPGHHAFAESGGGFCLFNNIACAARWALDDGGLQRVMIVDWDVHHGNGTQAIFYAEPRVLYVSTHESPHFLYPFTGGQADEIGSGAGQGTTVNIPLPPGAGDDGYAAVFDRVILPVARRYQPQLILASAGYDAHWRDPLAHMNVSLAGFARMARAVASWSDELCHGRMVVVLEGGYDLEVLSHAVLNTFAAMRDGPAAPVVDPIGAGLEREPSVELVIQRVQQAHGV